MENWKVIAFLLAFGQGILLSLALVVNGWRQRPAHLFLGIILYVLALELLNAWGMKIHYHSSPTAFPFWDLQSYLLLPPSVWFFARYTTNPQFTFRKTYWLFYLPAGGEILIRFTTDSYQRLRGVHWPSLLANPVWFALTEILPIVGMVIALGMYGTKLIQHARSLKETTVSLSIQQWINLYGLFSFLLLLTGLWLAGVLLDWPVFSSLELLLTLFLFVSGYLAYLNSNVFSLPNLPKSKPIEKTEFLQYDDHHQIERLRLLFRQEAIHTQAKLSVDEVARRLHLPPRYVSHLINTHCQTNFTQFVNRFRVEEVIRKLNDPKEQHKTLLALAFEAGFSSKSTFNQVFKQHTGQAPSVYPVPQK